MRGASGPSLRCAVGARRPGCPLCASCGGATPRATEIFLDPGIRLAHQLLDGADLNTLVHQNRNTVADGVERVEVVGRSEEHTSELQSLMRSSYAVFCLKKKTNINSQR